MVEDPARSDADEDLQERFDAYEERVYAYQRDWWIDDAAAQLALGSDPQRVQRLRVIARIDGVVETADVYHEHDGWMGCRVPVQNQVLQALLGNAPEPASEPTVVYLLGMPGSGKSSVLTPIAETYLRTLGSGSALVRDADDFRVRLPEYAGGLGSHVVQREVVDLTYKQAPARLPKACHIIIDVVGDPEWLPSEMRDFAERGWRVVALCAEVPTDVAVGRAKARALETGRHVSIDYLRSCAGRSRRALDAALNNAALVEHWAVIDTSGACAKIIDGDGLFGLPGECIDA